MKRILKVVVAAIACAGATLAAIYAPYDLEQVPVDRLLTNLEEQAKARPQDFWVRLNLGRAHAMAYSLKTETLQAMRAKGGPRDGQLSLYVPLDSPAIPFQPKATDDPARQAAASAHLKKAIDHFRQAVAMTPASPHARISLGWCLDQAGEKSAAVTAYRELIAMPESQPGSMNPWVAAEAISYLIPLLDLSTDAKEIAALRVQRDKILSRPRPVTPIAVPLRDALTLDDIVDQHAAVRFDADGSGWQHAWTWITPDAAWLVYDQKHRGEISSALQLFGSVSFWMFWDTGYDAMRALDDNCDGRLAGDELRHLALWRDANSNGISERPEVRPLASYGIVSLLYAFERANDADRTAFSPRGVTFNDGTTRPTWDVVLQPAR